MPDYLDGGTPSTADVRAIADHLSGVAALSAAHLAAADLDADGQITAADLLLMARLAAGDLPLPLPRPRLIVASLGQAQTTPGGGMGGRLRSGGALLAWQERAAGLRFGFRWLVGSVWSSTSTKALGRSARSSLTARIRTSTVRRLGSTTSEIRSTVPGRFTPPERVWMMTPLPTFRS